jgi:hypothetical protein
MAAPLLTRFGPLSRAEVTLVDGIGGGSCGRCTLYTLCDTPRNGNRHFGGLMLDILRKWVHGII